ncbi:MAG: hypothetical protein M0Z96_02900 [Actinomycetota bacterium]|nr:hypothetical protein [Actinomycetota bacterium]
MLGPANTKAALGISVATDRWRQLVVVAGRGVDGVAAEQRVRLAIASIAA